jgi:fucose 4-O-acetylase-like acetyltransferase
MFFSFSSVSNQTYLLRKNRYQLTVFDRLNSYGILLVILGHNNFSQSFLSVIHTFNMPLFFFISGYLFHYSKYKQNPNGFISQKFKRLVVPYFITNIIILCTFTMLSVFKLYSFNGNSPIKLRAATPP